MCLQQPTSNWNEQKSYKTKMSNKPEAPRRTTLKDLSTCIVQISKDTIGPSPKTVYKTTRMKILNRWNNPRRCFLFLLVSEKMQSVCVNGIKMKTWKFVFLLNSVLFFYWFAQGTYISEWMEIQITSFYTFGIILLQTQD